MINYCKPFIATLFIVGAASVSPASVINEERVIDVDGTQRKYVLYVPDGVKDNAPVVFSLHGASGHDTDRSPMRTSVADQNGFIIVYPQGADQYFPIFGGSVPGWNAAGVPNEDLDFFKAIIGAIGNEYSIDSKRIYCCGFSNGGMMTYSNAAAASDLFAAFASISGFPLNEFHLRTTSARPVPFMHIHGKQDNFVKYSRMPVIRDAMVARNGCSAVPQVEEVLGKYRKSVYEAREGGFPYVYYEIDDMGHNDYTENTPDGNSAATMWNFLSRYSLDDPCDRSLKWRLNIDEPGFIPRNRSWQVNNSLTRFSYGKPRMESNADNNVYPSLQFDAGSYKLCFSTDGSKGNRVYVKIEPLDGGEPVFSKSAAIGDEVVIPFSLQAFTECKITIVKTSADDRFTDFAIYSTDGTTEPMGCEDDEIPAEPQDENHGSLIEIPQSQNNGADGFSRTQCVTAEGYTLYTATGDLQIAFKMVDIDVTDCDYVVIKFAEPVAGGWHLAFWNGIDLTAVAEGTTEYVFHLEPEMISTGVLPQICLMTFFGGYESPLTAKVSGVYKHSLKDASVIMLENKIRATATYSVSGIATPTPRKGLNIVRMSDGSVRKLMIL